MKKMVMILIFVFSISANAQWEQCTNGLFGEWISCIKIINDTLYCSESSGPLFYSTNNGKNWQLLGLQEGCHDLIIRNNRMIAAVGHYGIKYSDDNGKTWIEANNIEGDRFSLEVIGNKIFADGFSYSDDNGSNWVDVLTPGNYRFDKMVYFENTIYMCGFNGIYSSSDEGITWKDISGNIKGKYFTTIAAMKNLLIAGSYKEGLFISADSGKTWMKQIQTLVDSKVIDIEINSNNLFVCGGNGLILSNDNGANWSCLTKSIGKISVRKVAFEDSNIYIGTDRGFFFSNDKGKSWEERNIGLYNKDVFQLIKTEESLIANTSRGLFHFNGANEWFPSNDSTNNGGLKYIIANRNNCLAFDPGGCVYFSNDIGYTWKINDTINLYGDIISAYATDNNVFFSSGSGLYYGDWTGSKWERIDSMKHTVNTINCINNNLLVNTNNGFYSSSDFGHSWNLKQGHPYDKYWKGITNYKNLIILRTSKGLYSSSNAGLDWLSCNLDSIIVSGFEIYNDVFIVGTDDGCYISENLHDWKKAGLNENYILNLINFKDYIYALTYNGIYRAKLDNFGILSVCTDANNTFSISPNPATDFIEISNSPSNKRGLGCVSEELTIKIYNVFGELLLNNSQFSIISRSEAKTSEVHSQLRVDVSTLAPGLYFIRVGDSMQKFIKL